jgi:hypothetical protein
MPEMASCYVKEGGKIERKKGSGFVNFTVQQATKTMGGVDV